MHRLPLLVVAAIACSAQPPTRPDVVAPPALTCPEQARFAGRWAIEELHAWSLITGEIGTSRRRELGISLDLDCSLALGSHRDLALEDGELEVPDIYPEGHTQPLRLAVVELGGEDYLIGRALLMPDNSTTRWYESVLIGVREGQTPELSHARCLVDCLLSCDATFELELDLACARSCEDPSRAHTCDAVAPPPFDLAFERVDTLADSCDGPCEISSDGPIDPTRPEYHLIAAHTQTDSGQHNVRVHVGFEDPDGWWLSTPLYEPSDTACSTSKAIDVWGYPSPPLSPLWPLAGLSLFEWRVRSACDRPREAPSCNGNGVAPHASAFVYGILLCATDRPPRCARVARGTYQRQAWNACGGQPGRRESVRRDYDLRLQAGGRLTLVRNFVRELRTRVLD